MSAPTPDPSDLRARDAIPIRRALISVSDKSGLLDLASALAAAGVELVSTGSTAATIAAAGHAVTEVSAVTGFPESLDGRVKTLHPAIHAGILADLRRERHEQELGELGVQPFELVVVNLYPFVETVARGARGDEAVEQIDIGGPAMVRASAKNHANVAIVVSPADYPRIVESLAVGGTTLAERQRLAGAAFAHTAAYDAAVADFFASSVGDHADVGGDAGVGDHADVGGPAASGAGGVIIQGSVSVPGGETSLGGTATAGFPEPASAPGSTPTVAEPAAGGTDAEEEAPEELFPAIVQQEFQRRQVLRYGENAHQSAALYTCEGQGLAQAEQLHGKEMSYNNFVDADGAVRAAYDFAEPAVAIIKHAQPCGIAIAGRGADSIASAHMRAHECDPVSAFGGVIAANREVTLQMAEAVANIFTEVLVAPSFSIDALSVLTTKKNLRLLRLPEGYRREPMEFRQISGGLLVQEPDVFDDFDSSGWRLVAGEEADAATRADLEFAWRAVRAVKSNAILLAQAGASVGIGMGQVNRVDSCRLAVSRAGERASGSVAASDAFFPFADGLEVLLSAGVRAVVQPSGSVRDEEVVAAAEKAGVTMYFTGERHFYH